MLVVTELCVCEVLFTFYFLHAFCLSWDQQSLCITQSLCFPHTCPNSISCSVLVVWRSSGCAQMLPEEASPALWFSACLAHVSPAGICFHQIQGFPLPFAYLSLPFSRVFPFLGSISSFWWNTSLVAYWERMHRIYIFKDLAHLKMFSATPPCV